jgi:hypothetical protein
MNAPPEYSRFSLRPLWLGLLLALAVLCRAASASIFDRLKDGAATRLTRAPYVLSTTPTSAYLVWNTDRPGGSIVEYSRDGQTQWKHLILTQSLRRHVVHLTGLQPSSAYRYRVGSNGQLLASGRLQTARAANEPFRFAVWGDSGAGSTSQKQLARQIDRNWPNLLLHTGDLIYDRGAAQDYDARFFRIYAPILARVPFYGSLGNHDVLTRNGQPFLDNFILPRNGPQGLQAERNYSFDYGNAHFVALDSNLSEAALRRFVAPWLDLDLRRSKAVWKFVFFHHPPYSSGEHGDVIRTQRVLTPIFTARGVDVVFNGHDHDYERMKPIRGVTYIVTGGGGAGLYRHAQRSPRTAKWYNASHSFTRVDVSGSTLRGRQINQSGQTIDNWSLTK